MQQQMAAYQEKLQRKKSKTRHLKEGKEQLLAEKELVLRDKQ